MMKLLTICTMSLSLLLPLSAGWLPNDINISNNAAIRDRTSVNAWCVAGVGDIVHAVWVRGVQPTDVLYSRSTNGGTVWDSLQTLGLNQNPSVAAVADTVHVVWSTGSQIIYKRNDSGGSPEEWEDSCSLGVGAKPCVAAQGKYVHVVWNSPSALKYRRYNGVSWDTTQTLASTYPVDPVVAVYGDYIFVVWWKVSVGIYFMRNTSLGQSNKWDSETLLVASTNAKHPSVAACNSTVSDTTIHVYVSWYDQVDTWDQIFYKRSTDAGQNWQSDSQLTSGSKSSQWPSVAAHDLKGHFVWCSAVPSEGGWEVYYKKVPSLTSPIKISNDDLEEWPTIDSYGDTLHVVWMSKRNGEYDIFYNRYTPPDTVPPDTPYIAHAKKSDTSVVLTWNKITTDTLGNSEAMDYYIVYRDTLAAYIPDSSDSVGSVAHPETSFTDTGALSTSHSYYYLIKAVDSTGNRSKKSNMGFKFNKFFNENPLKTDKNWVSLPYNCVYECVEDLTYDLSPSGDPLKKITNMRDNQLFESWSFTIVPFPRWTGSNFAIVLGRAYEMVSENDTTLVFVGSNEPDSSIRLIANPGATDKNWRSISYNAIYDSVKDITDESFSNGYPVKKITNMRDDQLFESWSFTKVPFEHWTGTNFVIEQGRGYEFVTVDTNIFTWWWNPSEHSNEPEGALLTRGDQDGLDMETHIGTLIEPDRAPVWVVVNESVSELHVSLSDGINSHQNADVYDAATRRLEEKKVDYSKAEVYKPASDPRSRIAVRRREDYREAGVSHLVRGYLELNEFRNLVFTAYRPNRPYDLLTENAVGSGVEKNNDIAFFWFDVGNFKKPWQGNEEVILIVEVPKGDKGYFAIVNFKLDEGVDIQELGDISLVRMPEPVIKRESISWCEVDNDNIIGYSLYKDGMRLNEKITTNRNYRTEDDVNVKLVIIGGHETVYGSQGMQSSPKESVPMSYTFSIKPNPFAEQTRLDYALPNQASVKIVIYDVPGRKVKALVSEIKSPGYYSTTWNGVDDSGRKVSSGIYFVRFEADDFKSHNKVIFVR